MPITLTDPLVFDPGHARPQETYPLIRIRSLSIDFDRQSMRATVQYGSLDGRRVFVPGKADEFTLAVDNRAAHLGAGGVEVPADMAFDDLFADGQVSFDGVLVKFLDLMVTRGIYAGVVAA